LTVAHGPGTLDRINPYVHFDATPAEGSPRMIDVRDLFQWERFITPSIIRTFYGVATLLIVLAVLGAIASAIQFMQVSMVGGAAMIVISLLAAFASILALRIGCEFVLVMFRMNEHLGALRSRAEM
jgi:hypothetical protein